MFYPGDIVKDKENSVPHRFIIDIVHDDGSISGRFLLETFTELSKNARRKLAAQKHNFVRCHYFNLELCSLYNSSVMLAIRGKK